VREKALSQDSLQKEGHSRNVAHRALEEAAVLIEEGRAAARESEDAPAERRVVLGLAQLQEQRGDNAGAEQAYTEAVALLEGDPFQDEARACYSQWLAAAGRYEEAVYLLQATSRQPPSDLLPAPFEQRRGASRQASPGGARSIWLRFAAALARFPTDLADAGVKVDSLLAFGGFAAFAPDRCVEVRSSTLLRCVSALLADAGVEIVAVFRFDGLAAVLGLFGAGDWPTFRGHWLLLGGGMVVASSIPYSRGSITRERAETASGAACP
jgi:tetratricopeptide (TPR) repeat protein